MVAVPVKSLAERWREKEEARLALEAADRLARGGKWVGVSGSYVTTKPTQEATSR